MVTSFSVEEAGVPGEPLTIGKQLVNFYHLWLQVECTIFCNLQSRA
jgi:hypothetical protein